MKRLDLVDLPKDPGGVTGGLRKQLVETFNYTKRYPAKLALFKLIIKTVYNKIVEFEKAEQARIEAEAAKAKAQEEARLAAEKAAAEAEQADKDK